MIDFSIISNGISAVFFLIPPMLMAIAGWRGQWLSGLLIWACLISSIWFGANAGYYGNLITGLTLTDLKLLEVVRNASWLAFLLAILGSNSSFRRIALHILAVVAVILMQTGNILGWFSAFTEPGKTDYFGFLLLTILGMLLIESIYRNARQEVRWSLKFLCLSLGGIFTYDFFMYAQAMLFGAIDPSLWDVRGLVNAMVVPLLVLAVKRNPEWDLDLFVSRQVIFHSTAITAAGAYLMVMAAAGYYMREIGGDWGGIVQTIFFVGAVLILILLIFSGQLRARLKVFLAKHFYRNKYEYREEWLDFTQVLAESSKGSEDVYERVLSAIAGIMDSRGGVLLLKSEGNYHQVAGWVDGMDEGFSESEQSSLFRFVKATGWVINLDECKGESETYEGLELPDWLNASKDVWLLVPLMQQQDLIGLVVLRHSNTRTDFNWEDSDLLKTVGRQSAGYLALLKTSDELAQSRQFEAFNRLSAFVVHDLKNLVAQLSLINQNAKKFKDNPDFVDDAFETVENAVEKMNRLLANLRKGDIEAIQSRTINLNAILTSIIDKCQHRQPVPKLEMTNDLIEVKVDGDRLGSVLQNLIDNAQDATDDNGSINVSMEQDQNQAIIRIRDTGHGMDSSFIKDRLFRPFDTTKGNAGMGIGVFECREFFRQCGGNMQVSSEPGKGTVFELVLPLKVETHKGESQSELVDES